MRSRPDPDAACHPRSGRHVDVVSDETIMLHDRARIEDDVSTEPCPRIDDGAGQED
jgi:hypothetical protein